MCFLLLVRSRPGKSSRGGVLDKSNLLPYSMNEAWSHYGFCDSVLRYYSGFFPSTMLQSPTSSNKTITKFKITNSRITRTHRVWPTEKQINRMTIPPLSTRDSPPPPPSIFLLALGVEKGERCIHRPFKIANMAVHVGQKEWEEDDVEVGHWLPDVRPSVKGAPLPALPFPPCALLVYRFVQIRI